MRAVSMDLFTLLLVLSYLCLSHNAVEARKISIPAEEELQLEWQLKFRNQTPVKTVKTRAGLYDCVDIRKQPALKHPQLQNHEIQMRPTFLPNQMVSEASSSRETATTTTTTLTSVDCPQGTVPIRRYEKEDLIRAKLFSDSHVANIHPMSPQYPGQHLAILRSKMPEKQYGIRARLSLNNPQPVGPNQASIAEMWVQSNGGDQMNGLQTGWIVSPQANGDNRTHLFVLSTTDEYKTRCFNTLCGTFIQTDSRLPVDAELEPISVIHGKQHELDLAIVHDEITLHWWLVVDATIHLGYFPAQVFTQLIEGGTYIAWGGLTSAPVGEWSPPMGTGHDEFATEDTALLGYFSHLRLVDALNNFIIPNGQLLEEYRDNHCYDIKYFGLTFHMRNMFFYGGPGSDKCGVYRN